MKRLGVIGTLVWDRIWRHDALASGGPPVEDWGGVAYSIGAAAAARPAGWEIVPIVKLGDDLRDEATAFFGAIPGLDLHRGLLAVPEPTNRVELRYHDEARRCERLSGGVRPWTWDELAPRVEGLDALFVNFISGFEMELPTLERLRASFDGPLYIDIHSLMLGREPNGRRVLRPLPEWERWMRCADVAQLNEDELRTLAGPEADPWRLARSAAGLVDALLVTLGAGGATIARRPVPGAEEAELIHVALPAPPSAGDPTGCGDVWGVTVFSRLLAGSPLEEAVVAGHRAAARKVTHPGASALHLRLAGATDAA